MFLGKNKFIIRFITALTTVGVILGSAPIYSQAAGFTHKHVDSCYKNVTKTCSNHYWSHGRETLTRYCPNCKNNMRCIYDTYKDCCPNKLKSDALKKWDIYCETCGTTIETFDGGLDTHTYQVKEIRCGMKESSTAATVSISADKTGWTNGKVTVTCNVSISDSSFSLAGAPYSFNGGAYSGSSSAAVNENGSYSFTVMDSSGRTASESITISNIDTKAPTVSLSKSTDAWTEEGLTISASASDDLSGLASEAYSFGGAFSSSSSLLVRSNGTYSVTVRDNAGNTASASITVSNIGKDPKIIEEERRKEEEEKRRKEEEEEKRRKEEEERRRKEEEEKKNEDNRKKDDGKGKTDDSRRDDDGDLTGSKNEDDDGKKNVKEDDNTGKKQVPSVPLLPYEPNEDISQNDISANDVSANLITVNTSGSKTQTSGNKWIEKTPGASETSAVVQTSLWDRITNMNSALKMLFAGLVLVLFALIVLSTLDFVYSAKDGKFIPITLAKIKREDKRLLVKVPGGVLVRDRKYKIFLSPANRLLKRGRRLVVDVEGRNQQYISEDGYSFVYSG